MILIELDFVLTIGASAYSIGNIRLATESVGPISNYSHITDIGKWGFRLLNTIRKVRTIYSPHHFFTHILEKIIAPTIIFYLCRV